MLSLTCILISDLVIDNLFMHSLPGMILLYLATMVCHLFQNYYALHNNFETNDAL